mmetsp:Transcript_6388/g.24022  ORF Transcript_6388/g.24022 Transcript_6388/m.24022 type:complete len:83 (-) Transcript_6388:445-693(-)
MCQIIQKAEDTQRQNSAATIMEFQLEGKEFIQYDSQKHEYSNVGCERILKWASSAKKEPLRYFHENRPLFILDLHNIRVRER